MVKKFRSTDSARAESGFTLIEVMIAMTILSIGLMSIAVAQLTAIKVSSRSKHLQDAMFLARERMDTLAAIVPPEDPAIPSYFSVAQTTADPARSRSATTRTTPPATRGPSRSSRTTRRSVWPASSSP